MISKVKDVLEVDVNQEVKQVIDVEQREESEVQQEIGNYIVTEKLAQNFQELFDVIEQELEETGIWVSGFYGSGKSYFAKIFGYLLKNPELGGTRAQERFSQRLEGLEQKEFLRQSLGMVRNKIFEVVMLDLTKQGQKKGLPWILYENFLKELGFMDSKYGLVEFDLYLNDDYEAFCEAVTRETGESWEKLKFSIGRSYSAMRQALESEFPDSYGSDVSQLYADVEDKMNKFGAKDIKRELQRYLNKHPEKSLFFIADEVSQSISDELFDLSDLEGTQESLSGVGASKVWLIATAQEKLEDILSREGISKNEVSKLSDRFKTPIHISGEEVNKVIKERLLKKKSEGRDELSSFYDKHSGEISELTNLQNCDLVSTTTDSREEFIDVYPFHPYQLNLLQDFLFRVHNKVTGGGAPRGMIIVLDRVLKRVANEDLYRMATAFELGEEGEKFPETAIKKRFSEAESCIQEDGLSGSNIMEATYFLTQTGKVKPEVEDITKACLAHSGQYYDVKSKYSKAIEKLEGNSLLIKKEGYSIATELEERLISEMRQEEVGIEMRKRILREGIQETGLFNRFQSVKLDGQHYRVKVVDFAGDLLTGRSEAELSLQIADFYRVGQEDFQEAIEDLKYDSQGEENTILLIPSPSEFIKIDELAKKIYRYKVIESRYGNDSDDDIREIAQDMQGDRREKEEILRQKLKRAFQNGVLIRDFEEYELNEGNFQIISDQLQTLANNLYTKRLSHHVDEEIAQQLLVEENPERLSEYFETEEFRFFDEGGNFIGEGRPTVDEITRKASDIEVDGKTLEEEFKQPPYGWDYGDILVTLAVLLRIGRLKVKYEGEEILDYRNDRVKKVFRNSRNFRNAQFKATQVKLPATQKRNLVDSIKEIGDSRYTDKDLDHSSADIHVVKQIPELAKGYLKEAQSLERTLGEFSQEITKLSTLQNHLQAYSRRTVDEDTYQDLAIEFLDDAEGIKSDINFIKKLKTFQEENLEDLKSYRIFIRDLKSQLTHVRNEEIKSSLKEAIEQFNYLNDDPLENFVKLQKRFQQAKDDYYNAAESSHDRMSERYHHLKSKLKNIIEEAREKGKEKNSELIKNLQTKISEAGNYICDDFRIGDSVKCENCQHDLKTMELALGNLSTQESHLFDFRNRIKQSGINYDPELEREIETHSVSIPGPIMTVYEFRSFLQDQIEATNSMSPKDKIQIDFEE